MSKPLPTRVVSTWVFTTGLNRVCSGGTVVNRL